MRISDWSSDVCSSDLRQQHERRRRQHGSECAPALGLGIEAEKELRQAVHDEGPAGPPRIAAAAVIGDEGRVDDAPGDDPLADDPGRIEQYQGDKQAEGMRSEEHTSELQSLMRISYAVFCLKKKKQAN